MKRACEVWRDSLSTPMEHNRRAPVTFKNLPVVTRTELTRPQPLPVANRPFPFDREIPKMRGIAVCVARANADGRRSCQAYPSFDFSDWLFSCGLTVPRTTMNLFNVSNQNGAPSESAIAVINHPASNRSSFR